MEEANECEVEEGIEPNWHLHYRGSGEAFWERGMACNRYQSVTKY